jgi:hypothetical protein
VREYFKRYPKEQFLTEFETWRYLPSQTIEFTMKRLRGADRKPPMMAAALLERDADPLRFAPHDLALTL